jgi:hypothetical protein
VILDFGIMGRLGEKEQVFLAEILWGLITKNYKRTAEVHFEAGYIPKDQKLDEFSQALRAIGEPLSGKNANDISIYLEMEKVNNNLSVDLYFINNNSDIIFIKNCELEFNNYFCNFYLNSDIEEGNYCLVVNNYKSDYLLDSEIKYNLCITDKISSVYYQKYRNLFINNYLYLKFNDSIEELTLYNKFKTESTDMLKNIFRSEENLIIVSNCIPNYIPKIMGFDMDENYSKINNELSIVDLKFKENDDKINENNIEEIIEIFKIPTHPKIADEPTMTKLGTVGVALNGIPIYNPYENLFENGEVDLAIGKIFTSCCGHTKNDGKYHYHKYPGCLKLLNNENLTEKEICDEIDNLVLNNSHSPLIGFALDGFPIYGPVGWTDYSKKSKILKSSYNQTNYSYEIKNIQIWEWEYFFFS